MFQGDVQTLRSRVQQFEKHIKKLKQFVDKEDTDALVKELEEEKNLPDLSLIDQEIQQVTKQVSDARRVKIWFTYYLTQVFNSNYLPLNHTL